MIKFEQEHCTKCKIKTGHYVEYKTMSDGRLWRKGKCHQCGLDRSLPHQKKLSEVVLYFGKYKGKPITEIPHDYLTWCLSNLDLNYTLKERIKKILFNQGDKTA